MITIAPVDLVLRCAESTVGASEVPANTNAGPYVERVLKRVGLAKGQPWCAAYVADIGVSALGDTWPVLLTGSCYQMHRWAVEKGVVRSVPEPGDVFLIWHAALGRFAHTGFVVDVRQDGACVTREGNTSGAGSREGWIVAQRVRRFGEKDRFIRWRDLVPVAGG